MKKIFIAMIILLKITGCGTDTPPQIVGIPRYHGGFLQELVAEDVYENVVPQHFDVFYRQSNAAFAKYEPSDGVYLGAWLMQEDSIRMFEYTVGKSHAVYVHEIFLGDDVPVSWLLHCMAALATPLIIVRPPDNPQLDEIPETDLIIQLAQQLGSFNMPMFIAFYPPDSHEKSPTEYTLLFRLARTAFQAHTPMAAFVWVAPSYAATVQNAFFPGFNAVDWVALPLFANWTERAGFTDVLANFQVFYNSFHTHSPIMILPLGVSHFTRGDYTYRISQAAEEISRLYAALKNFPRLGLIVYADTFTLNFAYTDDFSISTDNKLVSAYGTAVSNENFLQALQRTSQENSRWVRSAHHGFYHDNRIYISVNALENELLLASPRQTSKIDGAYFVESRRLSNKTITACTERGVIFIGAN